MTNIANIYRLVSLARAGVCLLLNGLLLLLFSFFFTSSVSLTNSYT